MRGSVFTFPKVRFYQLIKLFFSPCACPNCFVTTWGQPCLMLSCWPWPCSQTFTFLWFSTFYFTIWGTPLIATLLCDWQCFLSRGGKWRFQPIDAYPLFVVFIVLFCLGTSKSFSMGEFDKCKSCMGIFNNFRLESWD